MDKNKATLVLLLGCLYPSLCLCGSLPVVEEAKEVTIGSACSYGGNLFLFSGEEVMELVDKVEQDVHSLGGSITPPYATAAFAAYNEKRIYYFGEGFSKAFVLDPLNVRLVDYAEKSIQDFLAEGAPDAAAKRDGKRFLFRGCQMVRIRSPTPVNLPSVGLPCNIDAAWYEAPEERMVILRGDRVWFWGNDESVDGSYPFSDFYDIKSWKLKPYIEETDFK